ncbi:MAG TPA: ribonuclease Y [Armatimonadota bacterium]|jgi:ribonuclease Y
MGTARYSEVVSIWAPFIGLIILMITLYVYNKATALQRQAISDAARFREEAERDIEAKRKALALEARDEVQRLRDALEQESQAKRAEIDRLERRLTQREEGLERRVESLETKEREANQRELAQERARDDLDKQKALHRQELERISGLTTEEAKSALLSELEGDLQREYAKRIKQQEEDIRLDCERRARKIVSMAIQRCAVEQVAETTVSTVQLPSDDMKGRIIGREGRNIRAFETLTGVELIIDDTPEAVVLSAFDPVRREVARVALTSLISDGRIHPGRIEEAVTRAQQDVEQSIQEAGEQAVFETGVTGLHPETVQLLGKLKYRTSYGQQILKHSVEVAHLAGVMAAELGANTWLAKRAALLHDLGKAVDFEIEGAHNTIGVDLARRYGESPEVCHCILAHHGDPAPETVEAVIVQCADAISAARPGARREVLETYIKRLQKLETLARSFPGVEKTFAMQAGREIRIMVRPEQVDDNLAACLARETARRIEEELQYPGQIKVTVIRETRATEYAR